MYKKEGNSYIYLKKDGKKELKREEEGKFETQYLSRDGHRAAKEKQKTLMEIKLYNWASEWEQASERERVWERFCVNSAEWVCVWQEERNQGCYDVTKWTHHARNDKLCRVKIGRKQMSTPKQTKKHFFVKI